MARPTIGRLAEHAIFIALSLLFAARFFPLAHPGTPAITDGDPALMCWTLQWVSHALVTDPLHLFNGNTFFPYPRAVALTDPMISLALVNTVVRAFTDNPWVGYNLLILLAYYLCAVSGAWLGEEITGSRLAGFWGGIYWAFLFFRVHHIGHLQILSVQGIPAAVVCLLRFRRNPTWRAATLFVVVFLAQALVSWYLAVILSVVIAVVAAIAWIEPHRPPLRYAVFMVAVIAVVVAPFAVPYARAFEDSTLADRRAAIDTFGDAVKASDYLTPPAETIVGHRIAGNRYTVWGENTLYVGYVPLALVLVALIAADVRPVSARRWILTGLALGVAGFVLALGFVSPRYGVRLPLHYLARALPFLGGLRATPRFSLVLYAGVLVLSCLGIAAILARVRSAAGRSLVTAAIAAAFLVEVFPRYLPFRADHEYAPSGPDLAIAHRQPVGSAPLVVLHLPIYYFREPYPTSEAIYMLDSTLHWGRILNGFSGGVPAGFMDTMTVLNRLPEPDAIAKLNEIGVNVVALHAAEPSDRRAAMVDYFSRQPDATVTPLGRGDYLITLGPKASVLR